MIMQTKQLRKLQSTELEDENENQGWRKSSQINGNNDWQNCAKTMTNWIWKKLKKCLKVEGIETEIENSQHECHL